MTALFGRQRLHSRTPAKPSVDPLLDDPAESSLGVAYEQTHGAILTLVGNLDDHQLASGVPACPDWSVRDLLAHLAGVAADTVEGRFPPIDPHGSWAERQAVVDAHTAGQVASRRRLPMTDVVAEWADHLSRLAPMLRGQRPFPPGSMPAHGWVIVSDIAAHEQDLRGALGQPGGRDSIAVCLGLKRYVTGLARRIDAAGLPALGVRTEDREYPAGAGWVVVSVSASQWELFRALGSRRSQAQLRALRWSGDPNPYLPYISAYGPRVDDLVE